MRYIEIHVNDDTQEARHCFTDATPFRIHMGFTHADSAAGWRQTQAFAADNRPSLDIEIEQAKSTSLENLRSYWRELMNAPIQRVIHQGRHYVMHELGIGIGFTFRVEWLAPGKEPAICHLSAQGRIPAWMRATMQDNARAIENLGS